MDEPPATTPRPAADAVPATPEPGTSISVVSVVSIPPAGDPGRWTFPADQDAFGVSVTLEGRGEVDVHLELSSDGRRIEDRRERHEVDDVLELTFEDLSLPEAGEYSLSLEVRGPGVSQSTKVTVRRG